MIQALALIAPLAVFSPWSPTAPVQDKKEELAPQKPADSPAPAAPAAPAASAPQAPANPAPARGGNPTAPRGGTPPAVQAPSGSGGPGKLPIVADDGDFWIVAFDETEGCDLETLTKICQQTTGINFTYAQGLQAKLAQEKVKIFGQKRFPKSEFYSFYQIILFINGYVCTKVGPDMLSVVVLQDARAQAQPGNATLKGESIYVLPDELDKLRRPGRDADHDRAAPAEHRRAHARQLAARPEPRQLHQRHHARRQHATASCCAATRRNVVATWRASSSWSTSESANDTPVTPVFEVHAGWNSPRPRTSPTSSSSCSRPSKREAQRTRTRRAPTAAQSRHGHRRRRDQDPGRTAHELAARDGAARGPATIKELVARLDVEVVEPERTYHVYALENVKAKDLAEVLEDFIQDASRVQTQGGAAGRGPAGRRAGVAQGRPRATTKSWSCPTRPPTRS
jgi:hypothetical protein